MSPTAAPRSRASRAPRLPALRWLLPLVLSALLLAAPGVRAEGPSGVLMVTANVQGAEVWVEGELLGEAPFTGSLPVGRYQVRVVADNHDPYVRKVDMHEELTTKVEASLRPGKGTVEFATEPAGAVVIIDGEAVGPSPIRIRDLAPGDHSYRVEAEGFEPQGATFAFAAGQNLLFDLELRGSAGLFHIGSTPAGATVWLDGEQVGVTPLDLEDVPLADHRVRIALEGYADVYRPVDTSDGRKGSLDVTLPERGSKLVIKTSREDASVSINGAAVGRGARVVLPLVDRGTLQLEVTAPGAQPAEGSVRSLGRGTVTVKASLVEAGQGRSSLDSVPPLYARWTFWAASGAVAAGGVTGAVLLAKALEPPPPPEGDVLVVLP
jgi:hypothetical protein